MNLLNSLQQTLAAFAPQRTETNPAAETAVVATQARIARRVIEHREGRAESPRARFAAMFGNSGVAEVAPPPSSPLSALEIRRRPR
jgi:hypothetical protein